MKTPTEPTPGACVQTIHVINGEHYSGAERVQDLLAQQLSSCGFGVTFACVKPGRFAELRTCRAAPVVNLPMRMRLDLRPALALARLVQESGAGLLHAHTPRSLMVARLAAMLTHVPLVYHVHSPTSRDSLRPVQNWINHRLERFSLTGVDRLVAVSDSLRQHLLNEGVAPARVVTVPNGVPSPGPLTQRPVPHGTWTIGTIALFRPRKGLEVLLQALAGLHREGYPVRLRAVGGFESREYEAAMKSLADALHVPHLIDWVGFTQDVASELARLDLFVLPSLFGEGLPMVVLESMAAGVPVVSSRVEGVPEAVRDGIDGVLVEPQQPESLQRAIAQLTQDPQQWDALRRSAYQRHAALFSDRRMAHGVAEVYRDLLSVGGIGGGRLAELSGEVGEGGEHACPIGNRLAARRVAVKQLPGDRHALGERFDSNFLAMAIE
jgi:glycosyltransferase involved in cell wall biosynthesis